jgi:hypothetical protein
MSLWGGDFCETIDYKNYSRGEGLIGYHEASRDLQAWLETPSGRSLNHVAAPFPGWRRKQRMNLMNDMNLFTRNYSFAHAHKGE